MIGLGLKHIILTEESSIPFCCMRHHGNLTRQGAFLIVMYYAFRDYNITILLVVWVMMGYFIGTLININNKLNFNSDRLRLESDCFI